MAKSFTRKHFFIDRHIQGRYMVTFLIPMLVMLVFMLLTLYLASQTIISTSTKIMKREIENTVAVGTQDRPEPTAEQYAGIIEDIRLKVRDFGNIGDIRKEFAGTLMWVFGAGILLVLLQVVMMTVFFSHKLAGPVFRFEKACRNVINGDYTDNIHLRKGDQMQGLALLLNEAMRVSGRRIIDLECRIAELEGKPAGKGAAGDKAD